MSSTALRLTLAFAALVTFATALILGAGTLILKRQMIRGIELLNAAEATELRERLGATPDRHPLADLPRLLTPHLQIDAALYFCQIHDAEGRVLYRSPNLGESILPDLTTAAQPTPLHRTLDLPVLGILHVSEFPLGTWHLQIASPLAPTERLLAEHTRVSLLLLAATVLLSLLLGWLFARYALAPLRQIHTAASRIRADNLSERIPTTAARDELNSLARLLNQTFDHLETSFTQVKRFTADASHELKTPLALIRLNAEKLRPALAADPAATHHLEDLLVEINRLHQIIESLLFLAQAESGALTPRLRETDTAGFIATFAEDATALAEDRGVKLHLAQNTPGTLAIEPQLIRQLLLNLVVNALNVSPPGGTIALSSDFNATHWKLILTDEGPGLPENQLALIFRRFHRYISPEQTSSAPAHLPSASAHPQPPSAAGQGLGLAISHSIAELHHGTLTARNRPDRPGLQIELHLPHPLA